MKNTIDILGYQVYSSTVDNINFFSSSKTVVNTINPHSYIVAKKDPLFRSALKESDILLPDGIGIIIAARVLKKEKIRQNSGPQIFPQTLEYLNSVSGSCFFLGSTNETLIKIKEKLQLEYPNITCEYYSPPFKPIFSENDNQRMVEEINRVKPNFLYVGMTAPKQEKWVFQNSKKLDVDKIFSIGAVFDFYAGTVKQPHDFWVKLGLLWLVRLVRNPKKLWKRTFISMPLFLLDIIRFKFKRA